MGEEFSEVGYSSCFGYGFGTLAFCIGSLHDKIGKASTKMIFVFIYLKSKYFCYRKLNSSKNIKAKGE
jgi:hypothetical protein